MAAVAASPAEPSPYQNVTLTGSAFALSTAYTVTVATPQGTANYPVTSDGAGAWTLVVPVDQGGSNTVTVFPVSAQAATVTFTTSDN